MYIKLHPCQICGASRIDSTEARTAYLNGCCCRSLGDCSEVGERHSYVRHTSKACVTIGPGSAHLGLAWLLRLIAGWPRSFGIYVDHGCGSRFHNCAIVWRMCSSMSEWEPIRQVLASSCFDIMPFSQSTWSRLGGCDQVSLFENQLGLNI